MGTERRFSRSPRSTRSRSADVDRLQKYAQRIEERRNTEGGDSTRLYATRWLNIPKSPNFYASLHSPDSNPTLEIAESHEKLILRKGSGSRDDPDQSSSWREPMQSDSDMASSPNDAGVSPDGGTLSFRWVPLPRIGDRPQQSQKFFNMEYQGARYAATKWITFAKHPSPASSRSSLDRKSSMLKFSSYYEKQQLRRNSKQQEINVNAITPADDSSEQTSPNIPQKTEKMKASSVTQRLHDLSKFRFDSKRNCNPSRSYHWTSKSRSSSDDEDDSSTPTNSRHPRFSNLKSSLWKKFNEKLRFSEDLSSGRDKVAKYERKAFSEDYGESQGSQRQRWPRRLNSRDRNEEAESTDEAGIAGTSHDKGKRKDRGQGEIVKHSSVDYKSSSERVHVPVRSLSYGAEGRPPTPVPTVDDGIGESGPSKCSYLKQKRKSTRYKVYLT